MTGAASPAPAAPAPTRPAPGAPSVLSLGLACGRLELVRFFRTKEAVVFTFAFPLLLLMLFGSIFTGNVEGTDVSIQQVLVAGVIASGVMSVSFTSLAISIAQERFDGTLQRLAGTPAPKAAYFVGKVVLVGVCTVAETALMLGIGAACFGVHLPADLYHWVVFVAVLGLGLAGCSLAGIAYARLPRSARSAAALVHPPFVLLQFISGVWVPEARLPAGLQAVASLFPLKWMTRGLRSALLPEGFALVESGGSWQRPLTVAVLVAWCVAGFVLCTTTFRWTPDR